MGNHDEWFAFGLPSPRPAWMSEGEVEHQRWVHGQLSPEQREAVRSWPYELVLRIGASTVALVHYARKPSGGFDHIAEPTAADFARLYQSLDGDLVVFGHDHRPYDLTWNGRRFLNPGSLGCHHRAEARALVLDAETTSGVAVEPVAVSYDDTETAGGL